jgi:hypothetical protein
VPKESGVFHGEHGRTKQGGTKPDHNDTGTQEVSLLAGNEKLKNCNAGEEEGGRKRSVFSLP